MNSAHMLPILSAALQAAPADAMDCCDRMYMAKFRSEPSPASKYFGDSEGQDEFESIFGIPYAPDLQVVELCNYKGEGEGWDIYAKSKDLPVWQSKSHSAAFFGA